MTVRVPVAGLAEGPRILDAGASHYLCGVRRLGAGDGFVAFDPVAKTEAAGTIVDPSAGAAAAVFERLRPASVIATRDVVLVYALAKGDKVDAVVRDATELGATRIVIARAERSVVKLDRADDKLARWRRVAEQAARQCGRADPPAIDGVHAWPDALDRATADACFCLDPRAPDPLRLDAAQGSIAFAIGPEGGLTPGEIALAAARGFAGASLGPFVLRTETVAAAVLGAVRVLG